ncbi:MAG TPA: twin-arginine translocation signal domain-containing protein, partial [bacterium]|nr:twin-arginine translocation signal domain-containing protein [bacterium]
MKSSIPPHNRRTFLKTAGAGLATAFTASSYRALAGVSPNERIVMGFIGLGGMGTGRLKEFMRHDDVVAGGL